MDIFDGGMTPRVWLAKRFLPALVITMGVAMGLAFLRAPGVFWIGFQGMFAGGVTGWMAGRLGRKDVGRYWDFQQRCWLGVGMMVVYLATHLVTLSLLNAGPVDTPLYWLGEVVQGFQEEEFVSAGRFQGHQGKIEAGWWIFMNALDAGLFWFLFIALCVVGVCPDRKTNEDDSSQGENDSLEDEVDGVDESYEDEAPVQPSSKAAFYGTLFVLAGVLAAGGLYWQFINGPRPQMSYSAGIAAMKQYEGQWRFEAGQGVFPEDADARSFTIIPLGRDGLLLKGVTENFSLSLHQDGRWFSGLLFLFRQTGSAAQCSARVRFSSEGDALTMSVVNFEIGGRRDIVLQGERIE